MFGCFFDNVYMGVTGPGMFCDWKMSGYHYNDYVDYRVGSPITSDYHWWDVWETDWHGPILRIGGAEASAGCYGQFISMHSPINMTYHTLGSGSLFLYTNY